MRIERRWRLVLLLLVAAGLAVPAAAQQSAAPSSSAPAAAPPKPKPPPKPAVPKPATAAAPKPASPAAAVAGGVQPKLLGQYGDWGAYSASPGGKKTCFALAKPSSSTTIPPNRPRNPIYMFISTRPAEKVTDEVSIIVGYPFKPGSDASAQVGSTTFALYTQQDGAWIKNAADEANMLTAMRSGESAVVKGTSAKGTQSSDTFTLRGISQALDRIAQDCK
jgi:hypothetical protein